ncbi:MAG: hypothetical protein QM687_14445 [Ferruginibacter sp.]
MSYSRLTYLLILFLHALSTRAGTPIFCKITNEENTAFSNSLRLLTDTIPAYLNVNPPLINKDSIGNNAVNKLSSSGFNPVKNFFKHTKEVKNDSGLLKRPVKLFSQLSQDKNSLIKFRSGLLSYSFNYRSMVDTPFKDQNISQHLMTGNLNFFVKAIPLRVNFLFRRSSSDYFVDINNVQVEYDRNSFKTNIDSRIKSKLLNYSSKIWDTLLATDYKVSLSEFNLQEKKINDPFRFQQLIEYKEILNLPELGNSVDSAENARITLLKQNARSFVQQYERQEVEFKRLTNKKDSVEAKYKAMLEKIQSYKAFVQKATGGLNNSKALGDSLRNYGVPGIQLPRYYYFLSNIRKAGIGRNQINYSELTSKNISVTGLNFEYNSWYYFAVTAGTVDFRFRDFAVKPFSRTSQFLYMARIGLGKIEKNYVILSAYKGRKQLFVHSTGNTGLKGIEANGLSLEAKFRLNPSTYFLGEVAQSLSQDFRKNPATLTKLGLKDQSNIAYLLKLYSYFPSTKSKIEGSYKFTGINFQSFSSFQTNASTKAWNIKADQYLFKSKLKIAASVRSNDFYNDFIAQRYQSNTVFKSIQASLRVKGLPIISAGYVPVNQLTYVDSILTENHFQSLNASLIHQYKVLGFKANISVVYNRFYNGKGDSTIPYYNAENIFLSNTIDMDVWVFKLNISSSNSPAFRLLVLDGGLNFHILKKGTVGFGAKGNSYNRSTASTGIYANFDYDIKRIGRLSFVYEKGYLPANNYQFIKNNMMQLNLSRTLNARN